MADYTLDVSGLNCPMPLLKTKKTLEDVPAGETLEIITTDPGAPADLESFCQQTGHELVESSSEDSVYRIVIRRRAA
ncbi:MAG: sulfurtransferase TusA family protein [Halieaceae bacterium]|jgi:tRNA 2-thiouridine synthesizing protein A|nr:sulfurtransferase TusA family protein [Halieaceae bacterium]